MTDSWVDAPVPCAVPVLPVSELAHSVAWYTRLGFAVRAEYDGYAILGFEGTELHLAEHPDTPPATESLSGCYLRVADADALHARWTALGAREVAPPGDRPWGQREFATEDPDGNLWRVGSPLVERSSAPTSDATDGSGATDGSAGTGLDHWLVVVAEATCAGCGLAAADGPASALAGRLRDEAHRWGVALTDADDDPVRRRPAPGTWSALEYGVHVRDLLLVFTERTARTLVETDPELGWWDHEAAIDDGWANESEVAAVVDDLAENARRYAEALDQVPADAWDRGATRRDGERFTIELMARFALHEVVHHRLDAERSLGG